MGQKNNMQDQSSAYAFETSGTHVEQYQKELYAQCQNTFDSFKGLGDVAEDMRILSLNAELAAGRAGTYGVSIRALTQYTRELVNRLEQINLEMQKVEAFRVETNEKLGSDDTSESDNVVEYDAHASGALNLVNALAKFQKDNGGVKYLNEQAKRIAEVVSQSNSIATNMAIEAATAGQYEDTFTNVANDMRGFVDTLKNMVTRAQDSIEKAFRAEKSLKEIEAQSR